MGLMATFETGNERSKCGCMNVCKVANYSIISYQVAYGNRSALGTN